MGTKEGEVLEQRPAPAVVQAPPERPRPAEAPALGPRELIAQRAQALQRTFGNAAVTQAALGGGLHARELTVGSLFRFPPVAEQETEAEPEPEPETEPEPEPEAETEPEPEPETETETEPETETETEPETEPEPEAEAAPEAASEEEESSAAAGSAGAEDASISAWSGRLKAAVTALPKPELPPATAYTASVSRVASAAGAKWDSKAKAIPEEAKRVLEKKPVEPPPEIPPMPSPDPVPEATEKVRSKSGRELPDQKLPDLLTTPHGFKPTVGGPPVDTSAPPAPAPAAASAPAQAPVSKTPIEDVKKAAAAPGPEAAPVAGQGQTITGSEVPPVHAVAAPFRADLAKVLARAYMEAAASGGKVVHDARAQAYGRLDLNAKDGLKELGSDLAPGEATWFKDEVGRVAEAAQIGKQALESAVADRKKELEDQAAQTSSEVGQVCQDETAKVTEKASAATATITSVRRAWDAHWDRVAAEAKGGVDPQAVRDEQERLSGVLRKHASEHIAAWSGMLKERQKKLDRAAEDQVTAYREAALADEGAQQQMSVAVLSDPELVKWLGDRSREVRHAAFSLKDDIQKTVDGWQAEMQVARDEAVDLVRAWADGRIGRERGWLDGILARFFDQLESKHEETAALAEAQTAETVTALGQDLQVLEDLKTKGHEGLDRDQREHLAKQDKEQQDLLTAYFSDGAGKGDTIGYLASMLQLRLRRQRVPEVIKQIRARVLELDNVQYWEDLDAIGKSQNASFSAEQAADQLRQAFEHTWGTDEDKAYRAVQGLTAEQGKAVRGAYKADWGEDLDARLADEMSGSERDRVKYGLEGRQAEADAAALRDAVQGIGTDEDLINKILRNKTPAERIAINEAYKAKFGEDLKTRLDEELSGDEKAITEAHWEGNTEKADAIEVKVAKEAFWGPDHEKIEQVYSRVRDEATQLGDARGYTSAEIDAEIARRTGKMQEEYKGYTKRELLADLEQAFAPPEDAGADPAQRAYADQYWKGRRDLVLGLATGDLTRADAGKIQIERTGFYADDDTVNATLKRQYDRAYERERRDAVVAFTEAHRGRSPNKDEMKALEAEAATRAEAAGHRNMEALGHYFEANYTGGKESFRDTIKDLTQGVGEEKAVVLMDQGGRLHDWQVLEFATKGSGTDEEDLKKLLKCKRTKAEIDALEKEWQERTNRPGASLSTLIEEETSGRLRNDLLLDYEFGGEPEDPQAAVAKAKRQLDFESRSGGVDHRVGPDGRLEEIKSPEYKVLEQRVARLEKQAAEYDKARGLPESDPRKAWAMLKWQARVQGVESAVETHRFLVDQRTELASQVASMAVAITVGVLLTVATGGAGSAGAVALIAAVSSLYGAATGIAVKAAMKGAAYGADELGIDIAVGLADAIVSAATAGVGGKLLKGATAAAKAGGAGAKGALAALGRMAEGSAGKRAAAHFIAEGAEGFLQSIPSSVLGTALNDQTWEEGNPFLNLLVGAGTGIAIGTFTSGAIGGLSNLRKGPHAPAPHEAPAIHGAPEPGAKAVPADVHGTPAAVQKELRDQITELLPPQRKAELADSPVELWDAKRFEEHTGSKTGQAVVIIKDGRPTVIVKQGADPRALAEEGFHLVQTLDPKTKPRVARLDEEKLGRWGSLDPREKLSLYREKLELEIDAQREVIGALEARRTLPGDADGIADRIAAARRTIDNLERRLGEVQRIVPLRRTLIGWRIVPQPPWLDQPARLFAKVDPKRARARVPSAPGAPGGAPEVKGRVIVEPYVGPSVDSPLHLQRQHPDATVNATEARIKPEPEEVRRLEEAGGIFHADNKPAAIAPDSVDKAFIRFPLPHDRAVQLDFPARLAQLEAAHPGVPRGELLDRALREVNESVESVPGYAPYALRTLKPGGELEIVFWEPHIRDDLDDAAKLRFVDPVTGQGYRLEVVGVTTRPLGEVAPHSGFGIPGRGPDLPVQVAQMRKVPAPDVTARLPEHLDARTRRAMEAELIDIGHDRAALRSLSDAEVASAHRRAQVELLPRRIEEFRATLPEGARAELDALQAAPHQHRPLTPATTERLGKALDTPVHLDAGLNPGEVRVHYQVGRFGDIRGIELRVGKGATLSDALLHAPTLHALRRYQGVTGVVRRVVDAVARFLRGGGRLPLGSRAHEAWLEVQKLPALIEARRARLTGEPLDLETRIRLTRETAELEAQLGQHMESLRDFVPGVGYVAATPRTSLARYDQAALANITRELDTTSDITLSKLIDRMAELEKQGRVDGLASWIQEAGAQAGDRAHLRARMAELARALRQVERLPPQQRVRLQVIADTPPRVAAVIEPLGTRPRVPGTKELDMRSRLFPEPADPADLAAFDAYVARRYAEAQSTATFDDDLARTPDRAMLKDVHKERERAPELRRLTRHAENLVDPLNPKLAINIPPGRDGVDVWVHYEKRISPDEVAQASRLHRLTGEPIHVYGDDAKLNNFPGIDGTIGEPKRPMQLKRITAADPSSGVRLKAQEALDKAQAAGVSGVEVYIEAVDHSAADVQAAWNDAFVGRPSRSGTQTPSGPVFSGSTIALIEIQWSKNGQSGRMQVVYSGGSYSFRHL